MHINRLRGLVLLTILLAAILDYLQRPRHANQRIYKSFQLNQFLALRKLIQICTLLWTLIGQYQRLISLLLSDQVPSQQCLKGGQKIINFKKKMSENGLKQGD